MQEKAPVTTSSDGKTIRNKVLEDKMSSLLTALQGIAAGQNLKNRGWLDLSPALHGAQHDRSGEKKYYSWSDTKTLHIATEMQQHP